MVDPLQTNPITPRMMINAHTHTILYIQDGVATTDAEKALLEYGVGDVTKPDTLPGAIRGAGAVVFASSASRKGGNAEAVDFKGVENIARWVVVLFCFVLVWLLWAGGWEECMGEKGKRKADWFIQQPMKQRLHRREDPAAARRQQRGRQPPGLARVQGRSASQHTHRIGF